MVEHYLASSGGKHSHLLRLAEHTHYYWRKYK
jgi:hypothetical protein